MGYQHQKSKKGFTLIELLVVVAIIGLLSSVVLTSLNSARVKGRDAQRVQSIGQLKNALELFYNDKGYYPHVSTQIMADCWQGGANWISDSGNYDWSNGYIPKQPTDPVDNCCWPYGNPGCGTPGEAGTFEYWSDGQKYIIAARLEDVNSKLRAEIRRPGVIDPIFGVPFETENTPLGKYVYAVGN